MAEYQDRLRRAATQFAVRQVIRVTAALPISVQRPAVRSLVTLAGRIPVLRRRVRENMRLALGEDVPVQAERKYFRHVGWFLSNALTTFHRGFAATPVRGQVLFDNSVHVLDEAIAAGRGAVLTVPHWTGHELVAATINLRYPMVMLVRDAPTSERAARKLKWYRALGAEIVLRPSGAPSTINTAATYLRVLKRGKMLGITPDLLADNDGSVEVSIFGRRARIYSGAFALAILGKAPMIRVSGQWQDDATLVIRFERAPLPEAGDRNAAIHTAVQDWWRWFEDKLRINPELWLFWLDKRWSRFLRATPRIPDTE
jgi:lauroyl/myristoyl acyltransferase